MYTPMVECVGAIVEAAGHEVERGAGPASPSLAPGGLTIGNVQILEHENTGIGVSSNIFTPLYMVYVGRVYMLI